MGFNTKMTWMIWGYHHFRFPFNPFRSMIFPWFVGLFRQVSCLADQDSTTRWMVSRGSWICHALPRWNGFLEVFPRANWRLKLGGPLCSGAWAVRYDFWWSEVFSNTWTLSVELLNWASSLFFPSTSKQIHALLFNLVLLRIWLRRLDR